MKLGERFLNYPVLGPALIGAIWFALVFEFIHEVLGDDSLWFAGTEAALFFVGAYKMIRIDIRFARLEYERVSRDVERRLTS